MTLQSKHLELALRDLPSVRVARITIDSIFNLDSMLQPGIRFGVTVKNTRELVGTPIASMVNFFFEVDVMDGDEKWIIQRMSHWLNGTYEEFYRIFYDGVCATRWGEDLGWRNAYDVFQLNTQIKDEWEKKAGVYNLTKNVPPSDDFYTLSWCSEESQYAPAYVPVNVRKQGLIITFKSYSEWETWQFTGPLANFSAAGNWKRIDPFIATSIYTDVYDADAQMPLGAEEYYQISNNDDPNYLPSLIPVESRVPFMKVKFINSSGRSVIMRYLQADFGYFHNYDYWQVLQLGDIDNVSLQKMLTGHVETHYHDTVQTGRVIPVTALSAPIARTFSLDPTVSGEGYMIIPESYSFGSTITIELTLSYLLQARFYKYVLYIDMRHAGPLNLTITKNVENIILKGDSTLNIALAKGIYKIEFIRQMSDVSNLVLYARHDFIPDDI